jgi:protein-arginine kinase activator protein McsA
MNCDICHTEKATIFFSQMAEGKLQKVNLCKACADDKGVTDPTGLRPRRHARRHGQADGGGHGAGEE